MPTISGKTLRLVQSWVENKPNISLEELCAQLEERAQMKVSKPTMCRAVQRLEMPRKKKHCMRVSKILLLFVSSETITVAGSLQVDVRNLVFIDEAGIHLGMARLERPGFSRRTSRRCCPSQSWHKCFSDWGTQFRWLDCIDDPQRQC